MGHELMTVNVKALVNGQLGVVFVGILEGIVIAVMLSILQFFERAWRPHSAVLGQADTIHEFQDMQRYPDAQQLTGLIMLR